jgi:hypothetical protein
MNRLVIILTLTVLSLGCSRQQTEPINCGVNNPVQDLSWLKEIVTKAEADKASMTYKGNYLGTIYMDTYKNQSVFMIKMAMGSGGLYAYLFDCSGNQVSVNQEVAGTLFTDIEKRNNVLYTNKP